MFGETTISYVKILNYPIETTIYKWMFQVPGPTDWKALVNLFLISPLSLKVGGSLLAPTLATGRTAAKMEGTYTLTSSYLIFS